MSDKKECRTTIRLTSDLQNAVEKERKTGFELSVFVRQQLTKYFEGKPNFIKDQFETLDNEIENLTHYKNSLTEKYQKAIELDKQRKERAGSSLPTVNLYRDIIPLKKSKEEKDAKTP